MILQYRVMSYICESRKDVTDSQRVEGKSKYWHGYETFNHLDCAMNSSNKNLICNCTRVNKQTIAICCRLHAAG